VPGEIIGHVSKTAERPAGPADLGGTGIRKTITQFAEGDLVNELLRDFRVESSVLCRSVMAPPWGFGVAGREVGSFHLVLEGQGWLEVDGLSEPIPVRAGDLVILPKGNAHWVKDSPGSTAPALTSILAQHEVVDGELRFGGDTGPLTEIVCGVFSLESARPAPWVERLPSVVLSSADQDRSDWRDAASVALRNELRTATKGGAAVVNRLLETMLADALSMELTEITRDLGPSGEAMRDSRIGHVLARMHESPEAPWTVEKLSRVAAMSRSAFAERFRSLVGEAPIKYLTGLRLARSARLLRSTDTTVAEIARRVGYGSEEALIRAFKMRFGTTPSMFRRAGRSYPRRD
jgi:AraC-like DNA-binding protein